MSAQEQREAFVAGAERWSDCLWDEKEAKEEALHRYPDKPLPDGYMGQVSAPVWPPGAPPPAPAGLVVEVTAEGKRMRTGTVSCQCPMSPDGQYQVHNRSCENYPIVEASEGGKG
jgi:hypothetical protein